VSEENPQVDIHDSARTHGVTDEDILHAMASPGYVGDLVNTVNRQTHRTIDGRTITEEDIAAAAAEALGGYTPDQIQPRPTGRPLIGSSPAKALAVRFPPEMRAQLIKEAEQEGVAEAEVVRRAVSSYLLGSPGVAKVTRLPRAKVLKDSSRSGIKSTGAKTRARNPR
jgi:hypothetical protein